MKELNDIFAFRSQHSTLEWDKTRDGKGGRESTRLRDAHDKRLFKCMDDTQLAAFSALRRGYELESGDMMCKTMKFQTQDKTHQRDYFEHEIALITFYRKWHEECRQRMAKKHMVTDIIILGLSLSDIDHKYRCRKGTAKEVLLDTMDIYAYLRGWPGRYT